MEEEFAPGPAVLSDEWIKHLPVELRESFLNAKVRSQLNALDDDTPLTQDLASIYLDMSDATLKRMRASGKGPQYIQRSGEEGSTARNQKVLYTVGALKDWICKNRTQSTGHAAIRRGLMFQSLSDLSHLEPWWVDADGRVKSHGYSFLDLSGEFKIHWMRMDEILDRDFIEMKTSLQYIILIKSCLRNYISKIYSIEEKIILLMKTI